jgi:hypothetical protein
MNIEHLQERLWAAARALPPNEDVPYAFEKRVMAALAEQGAVDPWAMWSRLLWRAAAPCVGIMLVVSVWSAVAHSSSTSSGNLAADLDRAVWGPLASINDSW